jgi:acyl-CoA-binding protein
MSLSKQIANYVRDIYFGKNWTNSNIKEKLEDVDWMQAITIVNSYNTTAMLVFYTSYYLIGIMNILKGGTLDIRDRFSYELSPIKSAEDWQELKNKSFDEAEEYARLIEEMPDDKFWENFVKEEYGNYYRNIHGSIEHLYYHFGQIILIEQSILEEV